MILIFIEATVKKTYSTVYAKIHGCKWHDAIALSINFK